MIPFPNILCSYAYCRNSKKFTNFLCSIVKDGNTNLLVDSGAYSAYKIGKHIDIDAYIDYIKLLNDSGGAWNYIQLDVVGNKGATWKNLDYMYSKGVEPMPVLTVDMETEIAKGYMDYNEFICIAGGRRTWAGAKQWQWKRANEVNELTKGKARSHFLAFLQIPDLYVLPLESADASTWLAGQQYSRIACYISGGRMTGADFWFRRKRLPKNQLNGHLVRHLDRDKITKTIWRDKSIMATGGASYCSLKTATAFVAMCNDAKKRKRKVFLVVSSSHDIDSLYVASKYGDDRGYLDYFSARVEFEKLRALRKNDKEKWERYILDGIRECSSKGTE